MGKMPENITIWFEWNTDEKRDMTELLKKGDNLSVTGGIERSRSMTYVVTHISKTSVRITRNDANCSDCSHPMEQHENGKCKACTPIDNHWGCWTKPEKMTEKDNNDHVRLVKAQDKNIKEANERQEESAQAVLNPKSAIPLIDLVSKKEASFSNGVDPAGYARPPVGFVPVPSKVLHIKKNDPVCPNTTYCPGCKKTGAGFISGGDENMGFADPAAQAFYEKNCKDDGYDGFCKMFKGTMIKTNPSRWGVMKCMKCRAPYWSNADPVKSSGRKAVYYMRGSD